MKTIDISQANAPLSEYARMITAGPLIITSRGKPVMAVIELEDTDSETLSLSMNPDFMEIIHHSRERHEKEGGISAEEMRHRFNETFDV